MAILTVSAVAVVAILLSKQQRGAPDPATAVTWEAACPGDLSGDFKCFERHYQTVVNSQSVEAAFTDIKDAYERSPYARATPPAGPCHRAGRGLPVRRRRAGMWAGGRVPAGPATTTASWAILAKIGYQNVKTQLNTICAGVGATKGTRSLTTTAPTASAMASCS